MSPSLFRGVLSDTKSGAWEIQHRLLGVLLQHSSELDPEEALEEITSAVLNRYRPMANLLRLVNEMWAVWERPLSPEQRKAHLQLKLEEKRATLGHRMAIVGTNFLDFLSDRLTLLTLSNSSTVIQSLLHAKRLSKNLRAVVGEGYPGGEGVSAAAQLRTGGIPTWTCADTALPALLNHPSALPLPEDLRREELLVVVGANSLSPRSFINKLGTFPFLLAAREASVPAVILATEDKLLPAELVQSVVPTSDPAVLGHEDPRGAVHFDFEPVPLELVDRVITESGVYTPHELRDKIRSIPISRRLSQRLGEISLEGAA